MNLFKFGTTVEDVIEFVSIKMYKDLYGIQDKCSDGDENLDITNKDDEDDGEDVEDSDGEVIGSPCKNKNSGKGRQSVVTAAIPSPNHKRNIDNDIPIDWTFPGYISFILYSPFAEKHDRLAVFKINNSYRGAASIAKKMKEELITKYNDWHNNIGNARGYTTNQQTSIDALRVQTLFQI